MAGRDGIGLAATLKMSRRPLRLRSRMNERLVALTMLANKQLILKWNGWSASDELPGGKAGLRSFHTICFRNIWPSLTTGDITWPPIPAGYAASFRTLRIFLLTRR